MPGVGAWSALEPWPDTRSGLVALKRAGFALAPLTNYAPRMLTALLDGAQLGELFDRREADGNAGATEPLSDDPSVGFDERERHERMYGALASLTDTQRTVVLQRARGTGFAEIGATLGISEGAAKLRAFRAHAELRRLLRDPEE